jgi:hypothetical protein
MSNYQLANIILGETVHFSISFLIFFFAVSACIHFIDEVTYQTAVFKQTPSKTPPALVEPVPAALEPVPAALEPVPALVEPVPALVEPVPALVEPVPAALEPVPVTLAELSIRELKALAKGKVKNYGRMKKSRLVEALAATN